jgi:hypothetical protein
MAASLQSFALKSSSCLVLLILYTLLHTLLHFILCFSSFSCPSCPCWRYHQQAIHQQLSKYKAQVAVKASFLLPQKAFANLPYT